MTKVRALETIGVATVVLSLLFVAYEIRQSNQIALVANVNDIYSSFTNINEALMNDPELAPLLQRAGVEPNHSLSEFTVAEQLRLKSWIRILLNTWLPANIAYNNGQLAQATYDSIFDDAKHSISLAGPGMLMMWKEVVFTYPGLSNLEIIRFLKAEILRHEESLRHSADA